MGAGLDHHSRMNASHSMAAYWPLRPSLSILLFFVTTWVICAPAAFLDVLAVSQAPSGIKPQSFGLWGLFYCLPLVLCKLC